MKDTLSAVFEASQFIQTHKLPPSYIDTAQRWFYPCFEKLIAQQKVANKPLVVGINGSQGSGKSTLAALLCEYAQKMHRISAVTFSIDDFYLTRTERTHLANTIHPLLATRGVPGTHDVNLMLTTLEQLLAGNTHVPIPRFDKACDDRAKKDQWDSCNKPLDLIVIEGWCLGATPQTSRELIKPVNDVEANEDPSGRWRTYINDQLRDHYSDVFELIDYWLMLRAPSFDCVFKWRAEQEQKLRDTLPLQADTTGVMNEQQLARFIKHYQRVTQQCLKTLPSKVDFLFALDEARQIIQCEQRSLL